MKRNPLAFLGRSFLGDVGRGDRHRIGLGRPAQAPKHPTSPTPYLMAAWTAIFLMAAFLWPAYMGLWGVLWTTAVCLTDLACRVLRKKVHP